jgi:sulfite dehydrogenase (cytochrome) subunit B
MLKKSAYIIIIVTNLVFGMLYSCKEKEQPGATAPQPQHTFSVKGSVKEMTLMPSNPEFPEHPGKTEFTSYCGICHSLRYISAQPDFPRKTWEAEVKKMVEKYGAPIDTANSTRIVNYLVLIKGNGS